MAADNYRRRFNHVEYCFLEFGLCMKLLADPKARTEMEILARDAGQTLPEALYRLLTVTFDTLAASSKTLGLKQFHGSDAINVDVILEVAVLQARTICSDMHPLVVANERVTGTSVFDAFLKLGAALITGDDPPSMVYLEGWNDVPTLIDFPASKLSEMLTLTQWDCDRCQVVNDGPHCSECEAICEDCGHRMLSCFCIR